jgi:uncharacterized membrane protein
MDDDQKPLAELTPLAKALLLLAGIGLSLGFALGVALLIHEPNEYFLRNELERPVRRGLILCMLGGAGLAAACGALSFLRGGRSLAAAEKVWAVARRISPLSVSAAFPLLFHWQIWRERQLDFLILCSLFTILTWVSVRTAEGAPALRWERPLRDGSARVAAAVLAKYPKFPERAPFVIVALSALAYVAYFSYYTICFHYSVRSGYDLALENNLLFNVLHGEGFFKSSPLVGPVGTHFGFHATLISYVFAPFYALYQRPEALLFLQSLLLGGASLPLYLLAARSVERPIACVIALAYLLYPALHGPNLFEFHYLPLGTFFLWWVWYCLESRRDRAAAVFVVLTLLTREDVSSWLAIVGAYFLLSGKRPRAGLIVALTGGLYFSVLKFAIMPRFLGHGAESFTYIYKDLIPNGQGGFGAAIQTLLGNPAFTMGTLTLPAKLLYSLQIAAPLAFIPLRKPIAFLFCAPGFVFCLASTDHWPTISITYQYGAYWYTFLFPAIALTLKALEKRPSLPSIKLPATLALAFGTVVTSYQFGAVFQQNTSFGGPIPYVFGVNEVGQQRHDAMAEIQRLLPPRAKVTCSGFTTPQLSSRPDAYSLTLGVYDAEYFVVPSVTRDFIGDEREKVTDLLERGEFGIVAVRPPFALGKRGHSTEHNREFLQGLARGSAPAL